MGTCRRLDRRKGLRQFPHQPLGHHLRDRLIPPHQRAVQAKVQAEIRSRPGGVTIPLLLGDLRIYRLEQVTIGKTQPSIADTQPIRTVIVR